VHGAEIERLVQLLSKLPGLGPRSAKRAVLQLLKKKETLLRPLADAMEKAAIAVHECTACGNLDTAVPCHFCTDPKRDETVICVVEDVADLWAMERVIEYRGQFHVLGGVLSALDGIGPDELRISGLVTRAKDDRVREVILATSATVDGQTTAHYVVDRLTDCDVMVTRLAHGVPVGGELDYLDEGTLNTALKARRPLDHA
jgi:recombination protein RecR